MASPSFGAPSHATPAQAHPYTAAVPPTRRACERPRKFGEVACDALVRTDIKPRAAADAAPLVAGMTPTDIQGAYSLAGLNASGRTVAIVDAMGLPRAESDLATYRSQFGLPACTTANGCFRKVDQNGGTNYPAPDPTGWGVEIALDLDAVSAACPTCHILLVEASSASLSALGAGVNTAVRMGAVAVSNSYGGPDGSSGNSYYNHPGVAITASSGDSGYGVEFPASSPYTVAVGGTYLFSASTSRGWSEQAWSGAGSGCSSSNAKPQWQHDSGCARRTVADVSADADPRSGLAIYNSAAGGWQTVGGTSLASPLVASVFALAGSPGAGDYPASYLYANTGALNDVTSGRNGSCSPAYLCTAGAEYDGPTGLGTPRGTAAFRAGGGSTPTPTPTPTPTGGGGTCSAPPWSSSAIYTGGDVVSHNGHEWNAKWWTQGEEPGTTGQWGVWQDLGACSGGGGDNPTPTPTPTPTPSPTASPSPSPTPTPTPTGGVQPWAPNVAYTAGDEVTYNGVLYLCLQSHTSLAGWEPPNVPALWQPE